MNVKSKIGVECTLDNETSGYFLTPEEYERVLSNERIIQKLIKESCDYNTKVIAKTKGDAI